MNLSLNLFTKILQTILRVHGLRWHLVLNSNTFHRAQSVLRTEFPKPHLNPPFDLLNSLRMPSFVHIFSTELRHPVLTRREEHMLRLMLHGCFAWLTFTGLTSPLNMIGRKPNLFPHGFPQNNESSDEDLLLYWGSQFGISSPQQLNQKIDFVLRGIFNIWIIRNFARWSAESVS